MACDATRSKKRFASTWRNWSDLPQDLVHLIARSIANIADLIAFRSVCASWRSLSNIGPFNGARQFPWLLQVAEEDGRADKQRIIAYSSDGRHYETAISPRKSSHFKSWCSVSYGWILFLDPAVGSMRLLHAFTKTEIKLPNRKSLQYRKYHHIFLEKAVLSSNPLTDTSCTLAIVYSCGKFAYWRPGDKSFTQMYFPTVYDVMFHKGLLYVVTRSSVEAVSFAMLQQPDITKVTSVPYECQAQYFLMELGEDLLVLKACPLGGKDFIFRAFVVELKANTELVEITDLGDRAVFIGANASFLLNNASEVRGCKPNHIYITHRAGAAHTLMRFEIDNPPHVASYNFVDRTIEYLDLSARAEELCCCSHPSLWMKMQP